MPQDPAESARLRLNLLRQLKAADPMPLPLTALLHGARAEGFFYFTSAPDAAKELAAALDHLADPALQFIADAADELSNVRHWKIATKGRNYLERQGF